MFFFFNDTATTEIYTLSLHDALPIWFTAEHDPAEAHLGVNGQNHFRQLHFADVVIQSRSEEHTSELQSQSNLVCRLLLEKKNITNQSLARCTHSRRQLRLSVV